MTNVTVIITTYNLFDFTRACYKSLRDFYPNVPVIFADGGSSDLEPIRSFAKQEKQRLIIADEPLIYEDAVNAAAMAVETDFLLILPHNVKFEHPGGQLELLIEPFLKDREVAESGPYGVKTVDWEKRKSYVGIDFSGPMEVDAFSGYCSLHRTDRFREVGGVPKMHYYKNVPENFTHWPSDTDIHWSSDLAIGLLYKASGYKLVTPRERVPLLHWTSVTLSLKPSVFRDWWYRNTNHIRISPLNDWKKYETTREREKHQGS